MSGSTGIALRPATTVRQVALLCDIQDRARPFEIRAGRTGEQILVTRPSTVAEEQSLRKQQGDPRDPDRDAQVVAAYVEGGGDATFRSVGKKLGLSAERVRQIIERWERETGQRIPRAPERRRTARLEAEAEAARKRIPPPTLAQRLLAHIRADPTTGCWEWTGPFTAPNGHRFASFEALGEQFAHRVSYRLWCGPIPPGHVVLQACGGRFCIDPFHLFTVTRGEAARLWSRGRGAPPQTHCKRGHALTPDNVVGNTSSAIRGGVRVTVRSRLCRICARDRSRRNYKKPPPRPPLPADQYERDVELIIRRVEYARVAERPAVLSGELGWPLSDPVEVPALEGERWEEYRERTGGSGTFSDWMVSRIVDHPRVRKALRGARGTEAGGRGAPDDPDPLRAAPPDTLSPRHPRS